MDTNDINKILDNEIGTLVGKVDYSDDRSAKYTNVGNTVVYTRTTSTNGVFVMINCNTKVHTEYIISRDNIEAKVSRLAKTLDGYLANLIINS